MSITVGLFIEKDNSFGALFLKRSHANKATGVFLLYSTVCLAKENVTIDMAIFPMQASPVCVRSC